MKYTGERMIPEANKREEMYLEHVSRYLFATQFVKNKIVLDIACGSGYGSDLLLRAGSRQVIGIDISEESISYCKERYKGKKIEFKIGNVSNIPIEKEKIDVIVSFETIEHVSESDQSKFIREVKRILKPEGLFIVSTPNPLVYPKGNPFHLKELSLEEFRGLLRKHFFQVELLYQDDVNSSYILTDKNVEEEILLESKRRIKLRKINHIDPMNSNFFIAVCGKEKTGLDEYVTIFNLKSKDEVTRMENVWKEIIKRKDIKIAEIKNIAQQKEDELKKKADGCKIEIQEATIHYQNLIKAEKEKNKQQEREIWQKEMEIRVMKSSKFWKVRKLYLRVKNFRLRNFFELIEKGMIVFKKQGAKNFLWSFYKYVLHGRGYFRKKMKLGKTFNFSEYELWIQKYEKWNADEAEMEMKKMRYNPKISVLLPVFDANEIFLRRTIFSAINQSYQNWELCVVHNSSTKIAIRKILSQFAKRDSRIKVEFLERNEMFSEVANRAAEKATGEFVVLLGQHDEFAPNALFEIVKSVNKIPELDVVYSDEDNMDENETRFGYNFKPDWSPELVLSQGYAGSLLFVKKEVFKRIGGFKKDYPGAEMYDFLLRLSEITDKAGHIPKILYHKRLMPIQKEGYSAVESGKKALNDALARRGVKGKAKIADFAFKKNIKNYRIEFSPKDFNERVTIIIPTKDKIDLLRSCIESIKEKTNYRNYDILVIDNNSREGRTFDYLNKERINYISIPTKGFNYSRIHNLAIKKIETGLILLLNNDTEIISPNWLTAMVGTLFLDKRIGAVGARLVYGDKKIQHGGIVLSPFTAADHANKGLYYKERGYQNYNLVMRNYSAVTAACVLTKKSLFEEVGGLDENNLAVAFNDVDYCLKLIKKGFRIVYNPDAILYHYENKSRGNDHNPEEPRYFTNKWKELIEKDPYYNINLSLENIRFELKKN
jgi:GT2 family glycosyltransferase/2-polyprenyl-3-methyl-5-hydroxy-6-metoxy-1,4-benzoquinol methylase